MDQRRFESPIRQGFRDEPSGNDIIVRNENAHAISYQEEKTFVPGEKRERRIGQTSTKRGSSTVPVEGIRQIMCRAYCIDERAKRAFPVSAPGQARSAVAASSI